MLESIVTAILAFASTNVDDIFILMLFFGNRKYAAGQIVAGQYLGIATLVVIAFIASLIGNFVDQRFIGLLGLFPIYLAIRQIIELIKHPDQDDSTDDETITTKTGVLAIATVTIANGGDNIGIYTPLLTTLTSQEKIQLVIVFAVMVYIWCMAAKYLAHRPLMAKSLNRYGHVLMPVVLLLLGVYILYESGSFSLLTR